MSTLHAKTNLPGAVISRRRSLTLLLALTAMLSPVLAGCPGGGGAQGGTTAASGTTGGDGAKLSGEVKIDGSSTVAPISEAMAEEFQKANPDVRVTVGTSGTGGGFKKFGAKEIDISDASRPIKSEESTAAGEFIELPVAYDGLAVVVNPQNTWAESLTVAELNKIWAPDSKVNNWSQVRAGFPSQPLKLYGAGTDSGTFDYFTDAVNGKEGASRSDYTMSEDDNTLVTGVAGDKGALGYFGLAYFEENKDKLKLLGIQGEGAATPVSPSEETVSNGTYQPLSRPLFIYVRKEAAQRPEVKAFIEFYLSDAGQGLVKEAGYIPLPPAAYAAVRQRFEAGTTGSVFAGGSQVGVKIEDLLAKEGGEGGEGGAAAASPAPAGSPAAASPKAP